MGSVLVKKGLVAHDDLLQVIDDAESACREIDQRHVAIAAVATFIERLDRAQSPAPRAPRARPIAALRPAPVRKARRTVPAAS